MSKPVARVVFSIVIALILVLAIYTSVLGASSSEVATKSAQGYIGADASLSLSQGQNASQELNSFESKGADQGDEGCNHDSMINPDDY
jgi:hypothetical protein